MAPHFQHDRSFSARSGFIIRGGGESSGPRGRATEAHHKWSRKKPNRTPNNPTPVSVTYEHSSSLLAVPYPPAWVFHIGVCNDTGWFPGLLHRNLLDSFSGWPANCRKQLQSPGSTPILISSLCPSFAVLLFRVCVLRTELRQSRTCCVSPNCHSSSRYWWLAVSPSCH